MKNDLLSVRKDNVTIFRIKWYIELYLNKEYFDNLVLKNIWENNDCQMG